MALERTFIPYGAYWSTPFCRWQGSLVGEHSMKLTARVAGPLRNGARHARAVTCTTDISGLQVPSVLDGDEVIAACRRSGGTGHTVGDTEILEAQARLAREEGLFAEPAGAAALAGLLPALGSGAVDPAARVVCLVTGSAFKVPDSIERMSAPRRCPTIAIDDLEARAQRFASVPGVNRYPSRRYGWILAAPPCSAARSRIPPNR